MRVESFRDGVGTIVPPGRLPRVQAGRLTTKWTVRAVTQDRWRRRSCRFPMGEPAAAEAAASERDVLLATKLNVPGLRPDLVPRPRLAERLDEGLGEGLVLVCAPAGYGKTVLLAEWVWRGRHPVAWLSLDVGDNDPARFWPHAVAALDRVRPGISERVGPLFGAPAPPSFEPLVAALVNEVAAQPDAERGHAAGPGRLSPDQLPAGARLPRIPAGTPAAGPAPAAFQPQRPASPYSPWLPAQRCLVAHLRGETIPRASTPITGLSVLGGRPRGLFSGMIRRG